MKFKFKNKKISGILTVIPKKEIDFDDEFLNFGASKKRTQILKETMGYGKHRVIEKGTCFSDLATFGVEKVFEYGFVKKEEIGALILVTESPDYFIPPTSNIIQGRVGLSKDVYCLDINNGCCGYLIQFLLIFLWTVQDLMQ